VSPNPPSEFCAFASQLLPFSMRTSQASELYLPCGVFSLSTCQGALRNLSRQIDKALTAVAVDKAEVDSEPVQWLDEPLSRDKSKVNRSIDSFTRFAVVIAVISSKWNSQSVVSQPHVFGKNFRCQIVVQFV